MKADIDKLLSPRKRKWKAKEVGQLFLIILAQTCAIWNNKENGDPIEQEIKRVVKPQDMGRATKAIEQETQAYYDSGEAKGIYTAKDLEEYRLYKDIGEYIGDAISTKEKQETIITTAIDGKASIVMLCTSALIHDQEHDLIKVMEGAENVTEDFREKIRRKTATIKSCADQLKEFATEREKSLTEATEEAFRYLVTFDATMDLLSELTEVEELKLIKSGAKILREKLEEVEKIKRDIVDQSGLDLPPLELEKLSERPKLEDLRKHLKISKRADTWEIWRMAHDLHTKISAFAHMYDWKGGGKIESGRQAGGK